MKTKLMLTCAALCAAPALHAQALDARVAGVGSGTVTVTYPSRSGVCGDGHNMIRLGDNIVSSTSFYGRGSLEAGAVCNVGPAHAELTIVNGAITAVRPFVGGAVTGRDLGAVDAADAAQLFL